MAFAVKFDGGPELERALRQLPKASMQRSAILAAQKKAMGPVAQTAQSLAPVQWGDMRDSIAVRKVRQGRGNRTEQVVGVGPDRDHFYGMFHEFGWNLRTDGRTRRMPARPFLRPAWDQHKAGVLETMRVELWKAIERAARRVARAAAKAA